MANELPDDVTSPDRAKPAQPVPSGSEEPTPDKSFQSYMDAQGSERGAQPEEAAHAPSPISIAQGGSGPTQGPTPENISEKMQSVSGVLGDIEGQLKTKNLKLKSSQKYLLRNKLSESNSHIRSAAEKLGVHTGKPPSSLSRQNPIARFLSMINDSQTNLHAAHQQIHELGKHGQIDPGKLLTTQVKISKAEQELEYSSVLLSKAVEDVKTLFNIQI